MRIPTPILCAALLPFLNFTARSQQSVPPSNSATQSEMQKWIATTDAQWQAALKHDVTDVREAELSKWKQQFGLVLDAAISKASGAGDLDTAVALRDERKRFAESGVFPEQEGAAEAASVKQALAPIRIQLARLEKENAFRTKALYDKYDQLLSQAQTQLTQHGRLDDALLVKAKRDEVTTAWMTPKIKAVLETAETAPPAGSAAAVAVQERGNSTQPLAGKIVIWNQNNKGKADRGTKKVRVILLADGKETWRLNGVVLAWDKKKNVKTTLDVPAVRADTLRIEVTEAVNDRGGLAEIEYLIDGKNIAEGCPVTASGIWENNNDYAPRMVTDGNTNTFWLLPDKVKDGWIQIKLTH
ncbi:MAG TPA: hypothetical protein VGM54_14605 [Chthoniobacter sp.]|jgi:hypothetical protein